MPASIRRLTAEEAADRLEALSAILMDSVEGGASVGFLLPMTHAKADAFWASVINGVASGQRILLVAEDDEGQILGTAQVVFATPENQPHRADVSKLLVLRRARRQGLGEALMRAGARHRDGRGRAGLPAHGLDPSRRAARLRHDAGR